MPGDFEGYCEGDITYCVDPVTQELFPVRVAHLGRAFLEVEPIDAELAVAVAAEFVHDRSNRRFVRPPLRRHARFGGCDERLVNAERESGQELRLLPCHYNTTANSIIRQRHAAQPDRWPLPTGALYVRWFHDAGP